jgi:O-antigen polymerase
LISRSFLLAPGLFIALLLSSLYFHINIGGSGFRIPNNILVWQMAGLLISLGLWRAATNERIVFPRFFWLFAAFPVLALFSGVVAGVEQANDWFLRLFFIWGGLLFLFALFQFELKQKHIDQLLFGLVTVGLLHAIVGIIQILMADKVPGWIPNTPSGLPTGTFQQINNQGSFQVTSLLAALWLLTRPGQRPLLHWKTALIMAAIAAGSFIIFFSGSRIALLALILGVPLMLLSRWRFVLRRPSRWVVVILLAWVSAFAASQVDSHRGMSRAADKLDAINAGYSKEARLGIYTISLQLIAEKPLFGHGIGSFIKQFQLHKPDFFNTHPDAKLPKKRVSHPHNEIIFWLVEGGATAGIGIALFIIGVCLALAALPLSRRFAYAALLLPIGLHTQVELPFYISATHWFVFVFLLFVMLQPLRHYYRNKLSLAATSLVKGLAVTSGVGSLLFLTHTMAANLEFREFLYQRADPEHPFDLAMQNPYFSEQATHSMMTLLYQQSKRAGIRDNVVLFADWIEDWVKQTQSINHYKQAIQVRLELAEDQRACTIGHTAMAIYPNDKFLQSVDKQCAKAEF